ncbi:MULTISPECIES: Rho GTPase-activating protein [unclassified Providencia]|uniref:RhoGAP domain-containing protein n=2 Tax=Providencia TaxID=586 RepID=UPI001A1D13B2|nr:MULTISPECIES: RhoGAP domain-containing protein [unclassified Providencia]
MNSSKINFSTNQIHVNKAKSIEERPNTSFIHSLKAIKNTVIQSLASLYHELKFKVKHKFDNIKIIDNPAYIKSTTALPPSANNQPTNNFVNLPIGPIHAEQLQEQYKLEASDLSAQYPTEEWASAANKIYLKNIELINQYPYVSEDKKAEFHSMNTIILALLSNPTFIKQEGILRISGVTSKISDLLVKLTNNASFSQKIRADNSFTQNELTGAIKALRNNIITKHSNEEHKLKKLINIYRESINQENETKEYVKNMVPNKRDKILQIAKNNADERLPKLQELPLHLQICMPLFVNIAIHAKENKMEPKNIAIAVGGGLSSTKRTTAEYNNFNKLSEKKKHKVIMKETAFKNSANELLMTLIDRELKQFM